MSSQMFIPSVGSKDTRKGTPCGRDWFINFYLPLTPLSPSVLPFDFWVLD